MEEVITTKTTNTTRRTEEGGAETRGAEAGEGTEGGEGGAAEEAGAGRTGEEEEEEEASVEEEEEIGEAEGEWGDRVRRIIVCWSASIRPKKNLCVYDPPTVPSFWPDPKLFYGTFRRKLFEYPIFAFQCRFLCLKDHYFDKNE